jgi:uncharacterized protein YfaS (alpha-2-macroglobulin family)
VTKDSNDRPVPADYSLQVVDESIYAIRSDTTEDIRGFFYGPKRNQVSTTHTEDLDRQIQSAAARVQRKEMRDMDTLANKAEAAGIKLRRDFRDTAFWAPSLQTDETGRGSSSFKLPDNLTQWRATVRAVGSNTSVGQATNADLRVSKPLIASLNLPRFVTKGDTFRIIAVVRNTSDHVQSVSLEVQTEGGIELTSKPATQISIPAKGEWRYDIEAAAAQEGTASLLMIAKGSTDSDAVLKQLDIQQYATWRTKTDAGTASQSVEGTAAFPTGRNSGSESLTFRLSPSLTGMILGSVDQLATYPYGCIEQTTSPTLADLALLRVVNASNSPDQKLTARLDDMIKVGIQRIYNHQNYDGGWGWGDHSEGDLYWTSYVMDALQQAKAAGYAIDDNVMQRGGRQLSAMVMAADDTKPVHKTNQTKDEYEAAVWQYRYNLHAKLQGLVVAAKESPDSWSAAFDRMVTKSDDLGNAGIAMLAMGLDEVGKHAEARSIMNRLMAYRSGQGNFAYWKSDRGSEYGYWYYFGEQDTYATAEVLRAILRMDPKNPVVAKVINWLTANRLGGYWVSTNDTAKIATAFAEYLAANPQRDFHGKVSVLVNGAVAKETDLAASSQPQEIVVTVGADKLTQNRAAWEIRLDGQGEVRYSVTEKYSVPWEQKTATASGIGITRYYYKLGKSITTHTENNYTWSEDAYKLLSAGNAFSPGDEVVVKLIVQSDAPMRHVLLEDPMPAGLEPIDEENSQYLYADWLIGRGDQEEGRFNYYGYAQREQHENRTVMLLEDLGDGRSVFYYVLRAVTPGDFRSAPPVATQMYLPSITGTGTSSAIKVRPK